MKRYPLRMWSDTSGWVHAYSEQEEAAWAAKGWIPEDVFRAQRKPAPVPVSAPQETADADPSPNPASPAAGTVHLEPKRGPGRPRKVFA
jgi:hypothetical protein